LAVDDISRPKSFKPETVKKKLDLPVQKNLLTKYFCILKWRIPYISLQFITFGMGFTWFSRIFVLIKMSCMSLRVSIAVETGDVFLSDLLVLHLTSERLCVC